MGLFCKNESCVGNVLLFSLAVMVVLFFFLCRQSKPLRLPTRAATKAPTPKATKAPTPTATKAPTPAATQAPTPSLTNQQTPPVPVPTAAPTQAGPVSGNDNKDSSPQDVKERFTRPRPCDCM